jgi:hypothetical protein
MRHGGVNWIFRDWNWCAFPNDDVSFLARRKCGRLKRNIVGKSDRVRARSRPGGLRELTGRGRPLSRDIRAGCGMFANGLGGHRLLDVINSAPAQFFASHGRRQILWLGVTAQPTATAACGSEQIPRDLIRDRDACYDSLCFADPASAGEFAEKFGGIIG